MRLPPSSPHIPPTNPADQPTGLTRLARRIARRTTDLLAMAIVAVGLLAIGGQLSRWWSTDPQDLMPAVSPGSSPTSWGDGGAPVSLDFGGLAYTLRRQTVHGDLAAASDRLLAVCREITAAAQVPSAPQPAQRELLAQIQDATPITQPDGTRLYRFDLPLPMVIGTRTVEPEGRDTTGGRGSRRAATTNPRPTTDAARREPRPPDASPRQRIPPTSPSNRARTGRAEPGEHVVCWGRAFPQGEQTWTLFLFHTPRSGGAFGSLPELPLPPGSRRLHALRDGSGLAWIGFEGHGSPRDWRQHFDAGFPRHGWRRSGAWHATERTWTARYTPADGSPGTADVHITSTDGTRLSGIVNITP